jgi:tetratricopeptide (TPR) repeat protein
MSNFNNILCDEGLSLEMDALLGAKKYKESILVAEEIRDGFFLPSTRSDAVYTIGLNKRRLGLKQEAMEAFLKSVDIDPGEGEVLLTQLTQRGYYEGETTDPINEKVKNGLEACMVDPECL